MEQRKKQLAEKKTIKKRVEKKPKAKPKPKEPVKRIPIESVFLKSVPKKKGGIAKVLYDKERWNII